MRTVFHIYIRDIRRICRNFFALVTVIGVCLIPSLYAWCNIVANMDPYSNTGGIPVAVVSNDRGAYHMRTGFINAGDRILETLEDNDDLGWVFCTEEEALAGVEAGAYYAALVIPEDFSASLLSILSGEIGDPTIDYYLNEKTNAIAPKVTDTGASAIQEQVNSTFLSLAAEALAELAGDTAGQVTDELSELERDLREQLAEVIDGLDSGGGAEVP